MGKFASAQFKQSRGLQGRAVQRVAFKPGICWSTPSSITLAWHTSEDVSTCWVYAEKHAVMEVRDSLGNPTASTLPLLEAWVQKIFGYHQLDAFTIAFCILVDALVPSYMKFGRQDQYLEQAIASVLLASGILRLQLELTSAKLAQKPPKRWAKRVLHVLPPWQHALLREPHGALLLLQILMHTLKAADTSVMYLLYSHSSRM